MLELDLFTFLVMLQDKRLIWVEVIHRNEVRILYKTLYHPAVYVVQITEDLGNG
jgi:hypothetical protein